MGTSTPDPRIVWPDGRSPASAVVFAQNTIDIAASPSTVWSFLTNCVAWPTWYARCSDVSVLRGDSPMSARGAIFRFKTLGFFFEPEVVTFEPERALLWTATGPLGTSGAHAWYIEPTTDGCHVVTEESQRGGFLRLIAGRASRDLHAAHEEWLTSLRRVAEAAATQTITAS